jgi:hypothetical protein
MRILGKALHATACHQSSSDCDNNNKNAAVAGNRIWRSSIM